MKKRAAAAAVLLAIASHAPADGGRMRLKETAGPFVVAVFTAPDPLTVGTADVSVLVQDALTSDAVIDADVEIRLRPLVPEGAETVQYAAAPGRNRLLRQAIVRLPSAGRWHLEIAVHRGAQGAIVSALVTVAPPTSPWRTEWPLLAAPAVLVALFVAGARRRRRRR